jgi:hypothetical protein
MFTRCVSYLCEHIRLDTSRRDAVYCNTPLSKVRCKGLDKTNNRHLRRIVQRMVLNTQQARSNRRHENNPSVVLNMLVRRLPHKKLRPRIQIKHMIILLLTDLLRNVPALSTRIAHDDVDFAKGLLRFLKEAVDLRDFGDIGFDGDGAGAVVETFDYLADFFGGALRGDVVDDDGGAALAEFDGAAASDATTGAGNEGNLAFERGGRDVDDHIGGCDGKVTWCGGGVVLLVDVYYVLFSQVQLQQMHRLKDVKAEMQWVSCRLQHRPNSSYIPAYQHSVSCRAALGRARAGIRPSSSAENSRPQVLETCGSTLRNSRCFTWTKLRRPVAKAPFRDVVYERRPAVRTSEGGGVAFGMCRFETSRYRTRAPCRVL